MRTAKTLIRQADLSLRWAHMPLFWFCHEAAHFRKALKLPDTVYCKSLEGMKKNNSREKACV